MADELQPNNPQCSQCGYFHPPLKDGEVCPMSSQKDSEGYEIDVNDEIVQIKNMLIANIQKKGISDHKKFVRNMIFQLQKIIDEYQDKDDLG